MAYYQCVRNRIGYGGVEGNESTYEQEYSCPQPLTSAVSCSPHLLRSLRSCIDGIDGVRYRQSQLLCHLQSDITRNANAFAKSIPRGNADCDDRDCLEVASPTLDLLTLRKDTEDVMAPLVHLCRQAYKPVRCRCCLPPIRNNVSPKPQFPSFPVARPHADAVFSRWGWNREDKPCEMTFELDDPWQ